MIKELIKKVLRPTKVVKVTIQQVEHSSLLNNRTILVTGGGSGFGFQMAKDFVSLGAKVIITGRDSRKLDEAVSQIGSENVKSIVWDVADVCSANENLLKAVSLFGKIDTFVNNAGVWQGISWDNVSEQDYDYIVDINAKGLFFMCQSEMMYMVNNFLQGKIINITSVEGIRSSFNPYNVSKWGANCITKGLAQEGIKHGIVVNAIAPGVAPTDINSTIKALATENFYCSAHKSKRLTSVEEISNLAVFLASDQANNIVGQVITVDGGWTLY